MPTGCPEHAKMTQEIGEIKGMVVAFKEGHKDDITEIKTMVKDIYDKMNAAGVKNAEFTGSVRGGLAALMGLAAIAGTVGALISKYIGRVHG